MILYTQSHLYGLNYEMNINFFLKKLECMSTIFLCFFYYIMIRVQGNFTHLQELVQIDALYVYGNVK